MAHASGKTSYVIGSAIDDGNKPSSALFAFALELAEWA
jgi:hypothetical protein